MTGVADQPSVVSGERLHPLSPVARGWQVIAALLVVVGQQYARGSGWPWSLLPFAVLPVVFGFLYLSWSRTSFRIDRDELRIDSGVLSRRSRHLRLDRLQAVDVVRPVAARMLGLAELRLEVAGGSSAEAPLAYLSEERARRLRAELLARAAGIAADTPEAPERPLVQVPLGTLLVSMLISGSTLFGVAGAVAVVAASAYFDQPAILAALVPEAVGFVQHWFRHFSTYFDFTVAESPDGLRLRHGLLSHRSQTVPPGRIQAVRITHPLCWRPLGWVRLEVNVAG